MNFSSIRIFALSAITSLFLMTSSFAQDQDYSAEHLKAARAAIKATRATETFDAILINAATGIKNSFTATNPNFADQIADIVDEEAIALAVRRGDLEKEAARLFAANFAVEELNEIAAFFTSPAGVKYLKRTQPLALQLSKAARTWANGISRNLRVNVEKKVQEILK